MMRVKINDELIAHLESKRVYLRPHFNFNNTVNSIVNVSNVVCAEQYSRIPEHSLRWDSKVEIGAFSYIVPGSCLSGAKIGRFTSIATNVNIMGGDHPLDRASTSTWSYGNNIFDIVKKDFDADILQNRNLVQQKVVNIEHDVWIGEGALIKQGVTIGTGAVVGARSVVTKDIEPYAVVAGNPAKFIKYRFEEKVRDSLLDTEWWDISPKALSCLDMCNIELFISCALKEKNKHEYSSLCLKSAFLNYAEKL